MLLILNFSEVKVTYFGLNFNHYIIFIKMPTGVSLHFRDLVIPFMWGNANTITFFFFFVNANIITYYLSLLETFKLSFFFNFIINVEHFIINFKTSEKEMRL